MERVRDKVWRMAKTERRWDKLRRIVKMEREGIR